MPSSVAYSETRTLAKDHGRALNSSYRLGPEYNGPDMDENRPKNEDIFLNIARTDSGRRDSLGRSEVRRVSLPLFPVAMLLDRWAPTQILRGLQRADQRRNVNDNSHDSDTLASDCGRRPLALTRNKPLPPISASTMPTAPCFLIMAPLQYHTTRSLIQQRLQLILWMNRIAFATPASPPVRDQQLAPLEVG